VKSYSVAMCTFNGEQFIRQQLLTILDQAPPPAEVIVADDGSTDETVSIVENVREAYHRQRVDPRIRILPPSDRRLGHAANFERVLGVASTDVIFLADQDDVWRPGRTAAALREFERDPSALLVSHDARLISDQGADLGRTIHSSLGVTAHELSTVNGPDAVVALCRRSVLCGMTFALDSRLRDIALPLPAVWAHDYWLAFVAASLGRLRVISESSYLGYRQHGGNAVGAGPNRTLVHRIRRVLTLPNDASSLNTAFVNANQRLESLPLSDQTFAHIAAKSEFEGLRAGLPRGFSRRVISAVRLMADGGYREFSSNGNWNILRDIIHRRVEARQEAG
jgi:glycosyltransferase involved in cell wall biosynthesis